MTYITSVGYYRQIEAVRATALKRGTCTFIQIVFEQRTNTGISCEKNTSTNCVILRTMTNKNNSSSSPFTTFMYVKFQQQQQERQLLQFDNSKSAYIHIYDDSFWGDSVRSFFRLGLSMGFSELEFLGQIASFERRLRGAAPTPLALHYPFCTLT